MFELSTQQQEALHEIENFIDNPQKQVFILKGYAGTGKTTLIRSLLPKLQEKGKTIRLMAPTGRAAKNLSDKTGQQATTIHKAIYRTERWGNVNDDTVPFVTDQEASEVPSKKKKGDSFEIWFGIRSLEDAVASERLVCIIDEASMISTLPTPHEVLHFGTDCLIEDLFTYGSPDKGVKFIFVGDPAQLPPVGDNRSAALDETFFQKLGWSSMQFTLTDVVRQASESAILHNAMQVRRLLEKQERSELAFRRVPGEVEDIMPEELVEDWVKKYPVPKMNASVVVCYTNALAHWYNVKIRQRYFPNMQEPQVGDVLQVVKNNY